MPKAGWPLARVATSLRRTCQMAVTVRNRSARSWPCHSSGMGGMVSQTSSVRRPTMLWTSLASKARVNRSTSSRSAAEPGAGGCPRSPDLGEPALERGTGPLEGAGHRLFGRVKDLRHLPGVEPQHVAQDQHGTLAGRQQLQRGHEGQRDGFPGLEPRLRPGGCVHELIEEEVRIGLEPEHLAEPG